MAYPTTWHENESETLMVRDGDSSNDKPERVGDGETDPECALVGEGDPDRSPGDQDEETVRERAIGVEVPDAVTVTDDDMVLDFCQLSVGDKRDSVA